MSSTTFTDQELQEHVALLPVQRMLYGFEGVSVGPFFVLKDLSSVQACVEAAKTTMQQKA